MQRPELLALCRDAAAVSINQSIRGIRGGENSYEMILIIWLREEEDASHDDAVNIYLIKK